MKALLCFFLKHSWRLENHQLRPERADIDYRCARCGSGKRITLTGERAAFLWQNRRVHRNRQKPA
jgi:hypothetical protein